MHVPTLLLPFTSLTQHKAHARVIYGPKYSTSAVFDVVTSFEKLGLVSHVIVHPKTKPYSSAEVVSEKCKRVLDSRTHRRVEDTYDDLLEYLRTKITAALSKWRRL